ncbi:hypothetical protein ACIQZO_36900 [Streptomyces sp. NPDC097617]|uniref:hypothetical protein n=1 Tax=Streptomyces sp. NPDC097617 TaxID=3366091 RepID=UPI0037F22C21
MRAYSGPDLEQEDVLRDFESVTASAGLDGDFARAGARPAECVVERAFPGPLDGTRLTKVMNGLADHGWRVTQPPPRPGTRVGPERRKAPDLCRVRRSGA